MTIEYENICGSRLLYANRWAKGSPDFRPARGILWNASTVRRLDGHRLHGRTEFALRTKRGKSVSYYANEALTWIQTRPIPNRRSLPTRSTLTRRRDRD